MTKLSTRCEYRQHNKCTNAGECECECHQTAPTQPAPDAGGVWSLSSAMTNDIIYRNNFGNDGVRPVCIDIPEQGTKRMHYAAIIVCSGKEHAAQIVADHNAVLKLETALELAAKRIDFLTNWIENTYGGSNRDVELGRQYAAATRDAALSTTTGGEGETTNDRG